MTVNVYPDMTILDTATSTTGWTIHNRSGTAGALAAITTASEEVNPREGTTCLSYDLDIEDGGYYFGFTSTDYSSSVVYIWGFCLNATGLASKANGGVYIIGTDGTNFGYWYVGGYDTYAGGWKCFVADLSRTPNANNGSNPNMATCTGIGIGFNNTVKSKAAHNIFFDFLRITSQKAGLRVSTNAGSIATWNDVYSVDNSGAIGVCRREGGVYFLQGPVTFGSGGMGCEFYDTGQLIVFEDADVPDGHYLLDIQSAPGATLEVQMGDKSGSRGVSGCVFKTANSGVIPYKVDFSQPNIDKMLLYGSSFLNAGNILFPEGSGAANPGWTEAISCNFEGCGEVFPSSTTLTYDFFINSDTRADYTKDRAVNMIPQHDITYTTFINCRNAVHIQQSGYYNFNNLTFVGSSPPDYWDIENSTPGSGIVINATQSNPAYANQSGSPSGVTTIINTVPLSIKVIDANGDPIENAQTAIYYGTTQLMNEDTLSTGYATENYNYTGDISVEVRVRKGSSIDSPKYLPISSPQQIDSDGLSTIITLYEDTNNNS